MQTAVLDLLDVDPFELVADEEPYTEPVAASGGDLSGLLSQALRIIAHGTHNQKTHGRRGRLKSAAAVSELDDLMSKLKSLAESMGEDEDDNGEAETALEALRYLRERRNEKANRREAMLETAYGDVTLSLDTDGDVTFDFDNGSFFMAPQEAKQLAGVLDGFRATTLPKRKLGDEHVELSRVPLGDDGELSALLWTSGLVEIGPADNVGEPEDTEADVLLLDDFDEVADFADLLDELADRSQGVTASHTRPSRRSAVVAHGNHDQSTHGRKKGLGDVAKPGAPKASPKTAPRKAAPPPSQAEVDQARLKLDRAVQMHGSDRSKWSKKDRDAAAKLDKLIADSEGRVEPRPEPKAPAKKAAPRPPTAAQLRAAREVVDDLYDELAGQYGDDPDGWPDARQDRQVAEYYEARDRLRELERLAAGRRQTAAAPVAAHLKGQHNQDSHGHDGVGGALDKLKLAGRAPGGFTVRSSKKVKTDTADIGIAEVDSPDGPQVRIGLITAESGRWDAGFTGEKRKQELREQLAEKQALFDSRDEPDDDLEDEIAELENELEALDEERTAILSPEAMADLRRQLSEGAELAKANKAKQDAIQKAYDAREKRIDDLADKFSDPELEQRIRKAQNRLGSMEYRLRLVRADPNYAHYIPEAEADVAEAKRKLEPMLDQRAALMPPDARIQLEDLERQKAALTEGDIDDILTSAEVSAPNGARVRAEIWGSDDIDTDWMDARLYVLRPGEARDDADDREDHASFRGLRGLNKLTEAFKTN